MLPFGLPLIPTLVVSGLAALGIRKARARKSVSDFGQATNFRKVSFATALDELKDTDKLRELADSYERSGLPHEADLLRKRAALRERPRAVQEQHKNIFRQGLNCADPIKVRDLANRFRALGATGMAKELDAHADGLEALPPEVITQAVEEAELQAKPPEELPEQSEAAPAGEVEKEEAPRHVAEELKAAAAAEGA
jgi:hypothetical protein